MFAGYSRQLVPERADVATGFCPDQADSHQTPLISSSLQVNSLIFFCEFTCSLEEMGGV